MLPEATIPATERTRPAPEIEAFDTYLRNLSEPAFAEKLAPDDTTEVAGDEPASASFEPAAGEPSAERPQQIIPVEVPEIITQEVSAAVEAAEVLNTAEGHKEASSQLGSNEAPESLIADRTELPESLAVETDAPETAEQLWLADAQVLTAEESIAEPSLYYSPVNLESDTDVLLPDAVESSPELPEIITEPDPIITLMTERIHELDAEPRAELLVTLETISETISMMQVEAVLPAAEIVQLDERLEVLCVQFFEQLDIEPEAHLISRLKEIVMASAAMEIPEKLTLHQLWEEGTHEQLIHEFQQLKSLLYAASVATPRLDLLGRLAVRFRPLFLHTADAGSASL